MLHRVLHHSSFREAAQRLRQAIQADVAAARGVAELEALAAAPGRIAQGTRPWQAEVD